jgi:selenide,water dikinase
MIAFDAQTSGGLLFSAPPDKVSEILENLRNAGLSGSKVIGNVSELKEKYIYLSN